MSEANLRLLETVETSTLHDRHVYRAGIDRYDAVLLAAIYYFTYGHLLGHDYLGEDRLTGLSGNNIYDEMTGRSNCGFCNYSIIRSFDFMSSVRNSLDKKMYSGRHRYNSWVTPADMCGLLRVYSAPKCLALISPPMLARPGTGISLARRVAQAINRAVHGPSYAAEYKNLYTEADRPLEMQGKPIEYEYTVKEFTPVKMLVLTDPKGEIQTARQVFTDARIRKLLEKHPDLEVIHKFTGKYRPMFPSTYNHKIKKYASKEASFSYVATLINNTLLQQYQEGNLPL
jgi:hypothetical protein